MADLQFLIKSDSPASADLMFWRVIGHEALARPSMYELTVLSKNRAIAAGDILGRAFDVTMEFEDADGGKHERHCHGHAVRFTRATQVGRFFEYRIVLRSWFWLLTKRSNSRILQEMPVLEVLDAVFEDSPIKRFKKTKSDNVIGTHAPHRYCVQYQESDYCFLSRLMEEEGIYYWFDAHESPGTMHLSDTSDMAHEKLPVTDTLTFAAESGGEARFNEIARWVSMHQFDTGKFASRDSDFKAITKQLSADKGDPDTHELADLETFEFPGGYYDGDDTDNIAQVRLDELVGRRHRHWALTGWPDVAAGRSFKFEGDPDGTRDGDYIIAACTFVVSHPGYESLDMVEPERSVGSVLQEALNDDPVNADSRTVLEDLIAGTPTLRLGPRGTSAFLLTVMPSDMPWRPPRLTARRTMPGPQTAIVVGKQGEEIWTEKHGRVKVQFHWDRYGKHDENSSCWIRVSQPWAGKGWGSVSIPRIGQEVIVDFLEGDPDRPIIVGKVYNGDNMPPYSLPGDCVVSGLKTNTHKGKGYNEMSMNDTAGKEKITIHGQYDMNTTVQHDQTTTVKNNRTDHVIVDDALNVDANRTMHVKGKLSETIDTGQEITVSAGYKETITGGATSTISGGLTSTVNGKSDTTITAGKKLTVTAGFDETVTGERKMTVTGPIKQSASATLDIHASAAGTYTSEASLKFAVAGSVIEITPSAITISSAGSTIKVDAAGVAISGPKISLNG
ncbi:MULTISPECIES: type VI secretion system Vgr family protein [unclassified Variovorax]|uniref:type VI secretion system Vgr family protein n=1 Tax=unclassified Variovorax TaxID=663243 RepID=UPI000887B8F8|nr:type VI secretion system tip protein TssI/VgrG [Variovorax sp. CF079]SDE51186.1 type VI secretion system secreted protein VgrG [Variovorax sp. CF079]